MASTAFAQLVDVVTGLNFPYGLALDGNDLYISQVNADKISKIDISLTNPPIVDVVTGLSKPGALFLDGDELYFSEITADRVRKMNITQPYAYNSGNRNTENYCAIKSGEYPLFYRLGYFGIVLRRPKFAQPQPGTTIGGL